MPLSGLTVGGKKVACERKTAILDSVYKDPCCELLK